MKTINYETRKQEILTSLQEHIPVTHSGMSPEEKLCILQKFADALITTVFSPKHSQSVTLLNLQFYLEEQANGLGLGEDPDIQFACSCLYFLLERIRLMEQVIAKETTLPAHDTDYGYLESCDAFATAVTRLEIASSKIYTYQ